MNDSSLECYDIEPGVPTLTLVLPDQEKMLPWSAFHEGEFKEGKILLKMDDWSIQILGANLGALWHALQLQDVRVIRCLEQVELGDSHVSVLSIAKAKISSGPDKT